MKIITTSPVHLPANLTLGLSKEQAEPRAHALRATQKEGEYVTTAPVQFKAGEEFAYMGDPELLPRVWRPAAKAKQAAAGKAEKSV